jgi:hypothetical protein
MKAIHYIDKTSASLGADNKVVLALQLGELD